jgi:S-ribosylhomocysteine lyase
MINKNGKQRKNEGVTMEKIASFTIDHTRLQPGLYVSRKDRLQQQVVTTFDLRFTAPNKEPVMGTGEMHAIEHLAATYLRNHGLWGSRVLYFGPMGCRTGFYLLMAGDLTSEEILPLVRDCFRFIAEYAGEIPGASAVECGNYLDMDLPGANRWGKKYSTLLERAAAAQLRYPE